MKKIYISVLSMAVVVSLTFTGCKKNSTPVPSDNKVFFVMGADNTGVPFVNVVKPGGPTVLSIAPNVAASGSVGLVCTAAGANITVFKLDAKKDGTAFEIIGPGVPSADLFSIGQGSSYPNIPAGTYTNVTVHAILGQASGTALPLVVQGVYISKTGGQVPFELDFDDNAEIVATGANFTVDGSANITVTVALHLDQLFAGVTTTDMDQAIRSTVNTVSNAILIDNGNNVNIYAKILANIAGAGGASVVPVKK